MRRGQLSLSVLESGIAALLVLAIASMFVLGPTGPPEADTLEALTVDLGPVLTEAGPDAPGLSTVISTESIFSEHRAAMRDRVRSALPTAVWFRLETPHGEIGSPRPPARHSATREIVTANGTVRVWLWYQ